MKVINNTEIKRYFLKELVGGDVFLYSEIPYMKLDNISAFEKTFDNLAVNLLNGRVRRFFDTNMKVKKVKAKLTINLPDADKANQNNLDKDSWTNPCLNCITRECGLVDGQECSRFWAYIKNRKEV